MTCPHCGSDLWAEIGEGDSKIQVYACGTEGCLRSHACLANEIDNLKAEIGKLKGEK